MKALTIILSILFFSQLVATAQNWQTFNSGRDRFFKSGIPANVYHQGGEIRAFHADTIEIRGQDSVFNLFGTFAPWALNDCLDLDAPGWLGKKVIIKPNGDNLLFNYDLDTILINTQALLNDSFVMYRFANGNYVQANVKSTGVALVAGIPDSVKTLRLTVKNASGVKVQNMFNGKSFTLSRDNGLASSFSWGNFPFDTTSYFVVNFGKITRGAIYDMEIGDVFQYSYECPHPGILEEHLITGKSFSSNLTTVTYTKKIFFKQFLSTTTGGRDSLMSSKTETVTYDKLDKLFFDAFPDETIDGLNLTKYAVRQGVYNQRKSIYWNIQNWDKDSCYHNPFEPVFKDYIATEGCGVFIAWEFDPTTSGNPPDCERALIYFQKGSETFGAPRVISSVQRILPDESDQLQVFPNPAGSVITISGKNLKSISICNILGEVVMEKDVALQESIQLDVSMLPAGVYFLRSENRVRRLIKN